MQGFREKNQSNFFFFKLFVGILIQLGLNPGRNYIPEEKI